MAVESVRIEGLAGVLKTLRELGPEASKRGGPISAALRKAAKIVQEQVKTNLRAVIATPNIHEGEDSLRESSGLLEKNIVITRGKPPAGKKGERMVVRVRRKAYPNRKGKAVVTPQVARLLEYGTEKAFAYPFIRPAYEQRKRDALAIFEREIPRAILRLQKKLARANGVKA